MITGAAPEDSPLSTGYLRVKGPPGRDTTLDPPDVVEVNSNVARSLALISTRQLSNCKLLRNARGTAAGVNI